MSSEFEDLSKKKKPSFLGTLNENGNFSYSQADEKQLFFVR
jgi:hypothetical protein